MIVTDDDDVDDGDDESVAVIIRVMIMIQDLCLQFNTYFHYYSRFPLRLYSQSKNDKRWLHGKGCLRHRPRSYLCAT